jgi:hypothetical protein
VFWVTLRYHWNNQFLFKQKQQKLKLATPQQRRRAKSIDGFVA